MGGGGRLLTCRTVELGASSVSLAATFGSCDIEVSYRGTEGRAVSKRRKRGEKREREKKANSTPKIAVFSTQSTRICPESPSCSSAPHSSRGLSLVVISQSWHSNLNCFLGFLCCLMSGPGPSLSSTPLVAVFFAPQRCSLLPPELGPQRLSKIRLITRLTKSERQEENEARVGEEEKERERERYLCR